MNNLSLDEENRKNNTPHKNTISDGAIHIHTRQLIDFYYLIIKLLAIKSFEAVLMFNEKDIEKLEGTKKGSQIITNLAPFFFYLLMLSISLNPVIIIFA